MKKIISVLIIFLSFNFVIAQEELGSKEKNEFVQSLSENQKSNFQKLESIRQDLIKSIGKVSKEVGKENTAPNNIDINKINLRRASLKKEALAFYDALNDQQKKKFCAFQEALGSSCPK